MGGGVGMMEKMGGFTKLAMSIGGITRGDLAVVSIAVESSGGNWDTGGHDNGGRGIESWPDLTMASGFTILTKAGGTALGGLACGS